MNGSNGSVLCIGQLVADIVVRPVNRLPQPGTTELVDDLQLAAGGCAANTACVLAKLGVKTALAGAVGRDDLGDAVLARVSASGVDVSGVVRYPDVATSSVIVLVDEHGERSFLYRNGANERFSREAMAADLFGTARFVHVGGAMKLLQIDLETLLATARSTGCITSLDTDWDPKGLWMATLTGSLSHLDYLVTNEDEGRCLTGQEDPIAIGRSLLARGPRAVVVKRGALGAVAVANGLVKEVPAFKVAVLDTTCAGDAFAAGFLAGLAEGWGLEQAVTFGNAAGALCTTQVSHYGVVSREDTMRFMNDGERCS